MSLPVGFLTPLPSLRSEARSGDDKRSEEEGKVAEDLGTYHVGTSVVSATLLLVCALPFPISHPFPFPIPLREIRYEWKGKRNGKGVKVPV